VRESKSGQVLRGEGLPSSIAASSICVENRRKSLLAGVDRFCFNPNILEKGACDENK
jgi:hypothetical protein